MISSDDGRTDPARLGPDEAAQEIKRLVAEIDRHDDLYYNKAEPEISDFEYDQLFRRLSDLETAHPKLRTSDSPTQRVGVEPVGELPKLKHEASMLSLDSSYEMGDVRRFDERVRRELDKEAVRYLLEPKLDGASLELVYEHGVLTRAVTRGNGLAGEGVVENVRTIRSVPLRLARKHKDKELSPPPALLSVRCEVVMYLSDFEALNARRRRAKRREYMNPRNVVSGALRQLDSRVTAQRDLTVVAFDILAMREDDAGETDADRDNASGSRERTSESLPFKTGWEVVTALKKWGFLVPERVQVAESVEEVAAYHKWFGDRRDELEYEIDGVVVKVNELADRGRLEDTAHHPRWAIALKFKPPRAAAVVREIDVQVGRTGVVTPVARLWPVKIGGVTIQNASLHNREELERQAIQAGDSVWVQRAGDVIPQVVGKVERGAFSMPLVCTSCGEPLVEQGPRLVCRNHFGCPAQLKGQIVHFASRKALEIEGLGDSVAELLLESGPDSKPPLVKELADLFDLTVEELLPLEGFAEAKARNLVEATQRVRKTDLSRFLVGLGIPEVGPTVAEALVKHFRDFDKFRDADEEALQEVPGVGPEMASAIRGYLDKEEIKRRIDNLLKKNFKFIVPAVDEALAGLTFVLTGKLEAMSRGDLTTKLKQHGAKVGTAVTANTQYLVVGDIKNGKPSSKLTKAQELGVERLNQADLNELLRKSGVGPLTAEPQSQEPADAPESQSDAQKPAGKPSSSADAAPPLLARDPADP